MTKVVGWARTLPRRLLHGGVAGEAATAGGRRIASNVAVQVLARGITMAISIVTVSLTARTLAVTGYGVWNGASSYTALFGVLTDLGFTTVAMQRMAAEPEREAEWLGALAGARTTLSLVAMAVCVATIPLFLSAEHDTRTVALILSSTILFTGAATLMAVFQSRLRAGLVLSLTVLQALFWLAAVVVLAATHASVIWFAVAYALMIGLTAAVQIQVTRRFAQIAWRAGRRLWRPLARVAVPMGIAGVMITIYYQLDSVLLLQIAGPREAGIYGAAYGFLSPLAFLPAAVMSSFFPVLSAVYRPDPQRAQRLVQVCADTMGMIGLPILAGTIALSVPIIELIYGPEFHQAAGILPILMIAFVSICFGSLAGFLAPLLGLQWRLALYSTLGALANVGLNLLLIPPYGAHGSAWATVATELLTMVLMLGTSLRALRLRLSIGKLLRTLALAGAMTAVMSLARPLGLLPAGLLGVLFYVAGLFALNIVNWSELRALRAQRP
jgi:PST family polysaccharide transporter